jgi:hypothetical protein
MVGILTASSSSSGTLGTEDGSIEARVELHSPLLVESSSCSVVASLASVKVLLPRTEF